jgi:hypothetical protein
VTNVKKLDVAHRLSDLASPPGNGSKLSRGISPGVIASA